AVGPAGGGGPGVRVGGAAGPPPTGTGRAVLAAGPFLARAGRLLGVDVPVFCELHAKIAFNDRRGAVPRAAPLTIWADPQTLPWSPDERDQLAAPPAHPRLVGELPPRAPAPPPGHRQH